LGALRLTRVVYQQLETSKKHDEESLSWQIIFVACCWGHSETRVRFGERWVNGRPDAQAVFGSLTAWFELIRITREKTPTRNNRVADSITME